jgi:hypothetical protein
MTHISVPRPQWIALAALIVGCTAGEKPRVASKELLVGIPAMPNSVPQSGGAGADAIEAGYGSPARPDSVAAWYRQWFLKNGWRLTGDLPSPDSGFTLYAEKDHRPIWLIIQPAAGRPGSTFSVIAAGSDSSAASGSHH